MHTQQTYDSRELSRGTGFVFSNGFPVLSFPGIIFWKWDPVSGTSCFPSQWRFPSGIAESPVQGEKAESWWERIREEDKVLLNKACADCASGTEVSFDLTVRVRRSDSGWGWLLVRGGAFADAGGRRELAGYAADISTLRTDRRFFARSAEISEERFAALSRHTHDLERAKVMAETANRTKNEFLANVSHELRTPLNGILSMLQLLQHSSLSKEQREYVRAAALSGSALLRILSDILDFSRMESGKMDLRNSAFDLKETLLSTMSLFVSEARRKGLETEVSIDERLPRALLGDDARVRQIVFNLVGNALKFTTKGRISLECSLLPYARGGNVWVYIVVRDTGTGIPPQSHSSIFEAFTQLDSSSTREHRGTGLGLGIVKKLVRMMGGNLTVESEVGEGTAIHSSLSFALADKLVGAGPLHNLQGLGAGPRHDLQVVGAGPRCLDILVAEDDAVGRFALHTFLRRAGHRAVCVETGWHALAALQLHTFDCLITDIQMPVMDGLEAVRRIRQGRLADVTPSREVAEAVRGAIPGAGITPGIEVPRNMPVVALTAHAMRGDREYFLRMGMDMYLAKPIILDELAMTLRRISEISLTKAR